MLATQPIEMHDNNSVVQQVYRYGKMMEKFPNQRSMHACGILISEEPITTYSALEMPPKRISDRAVRYARSGRYWPGKI